MDTLLELMVDEEVQTYLDYYIDCFSIHIALYDPDGRAIRTGKRIVSCDFCDCYRSDSEGLNRCLRLDKEMREKSLSRGKTIRYSCHAGLWEAIRPLIVQDQLVGYGMVGRIRTEKKMSSFPHPRRRELEKIYQMSSLVEEEKLEAVVGLFDALMEFMIQKNLMMIKMDDFSLRITSFIDDHLDIPLSLKDAARHMGMTPGALAHALRRRGLDSFVQLCHKRKMAIAEKRLISRPDLSVQELALSLGYGDPYYFSRVFRKYTHSSPSRYREKARP